MPESPPDAEIGLAAPLQPIGSSAVDGSRLFDDGPLVASRSRTSRGRLDELGAEQLKPEKQGPAGAERKPVSSSHIGPGSAAPGSTLPSPVAAAPEQSRAGRTRPARGGFAAAPRAGGADGRCGRSSGDFADDGAPAGDAEGEAGKPEEVARQICLRALTGASRTRKQLADLLQRKEIPEDAATAVLDRLTEVGLIDDAAFASAWVRSRQSGRGLARRALSSELRAKGVDPEIAAVALEEVDPQDEWDAARRLVARKLPGTARLDRPVAERRLIAMLARKGYGGGLAGYVVREALDERNTGLLADDEAADGAVAAPEPDSSVIETAPGEVGEGQARPLRQRGTGPRPHWLVDDTP